MLLLITIMMLLPLLLLLMLTLMLMFFVPVCQKLRALAAVSRPPRFDSKGDVSSPSPRHPPGTIDLDDHVAIIASPSNVDVSMNPLALGQFVVATAPIVCELWASRLVCVLLHSMR